MRKTVFILIACMAGLTGLSQHYNPDSALLVHKIQKDSTLKALKAQRDSTYASLLHADSVKVNATYAEKDKWDKLKSVLIFPVLNAGEFSGVVPVKDPTEIPDPNLEYKLLFELVENNPDSIIKEFNSGLVEVARKINLHVASGVPLKKIMPVIVVHAGALNAFTTNEYYKEHFKVDNPNIKLINELKSLGTKFIACGQAMAFLDLKKEVMLPVVKISLTAQTVISSYQLKGYIKY